MMATLGFHESLTITKHAGGRGGWMGKIKAGDDYTRDLEAWGTRSLHLDRENDTYRESIIVWDGTRITSTARLSDHRG
jgi:hypothetical protein